MRVAIVSDIHGNRTAFEAVLADLKQTSPDIVFHGGDLADAGSGPVEIVDQIRNLGWKGVAGNTDQMLASPETFETFANRAPKLASLWDAIRNMAAFTRERLGEERLSWLRSLPLMQINELVALVHASPGNPWVAPSAQDSDEQFNSVYSSIAQTIVVYGHIHQPFVRRIGSQTIANSGSVGQPHDGDHRSSYLLIDGFQVEIRRVEYELEREIQAVRSSGLPHAEWIVRTIESASPQMP
jgi:putative phosphoesterase